MSCAAWLQPFYVEFQQNFNATGASIGMSNFPAGVAQAAGIPFTQITGYSAIIGGPAGFPRGRFDTLGVISDAATYTIGKHSIKFGGEGRRYLNANFAGDPGQLTFPSDSHHHQYHGHRHSDWEDGNSELSAGPCDLLQHHADPNDQPDFRQCRRRFCDGQLPDDAPTAVRGGAPLRVDRLSDLRRHIEAVIFDPAAVTLNQYRTGGYNVPYKQNYNVEPRLGFAYDVFGNGRTMLRGAYGFMIDQPLKRPGHGPLQQPAEHRQSHPSSVDQFRHGHEHGYDHECASHSRRESLCCCCGCVDRRVGSAAELQERLC